MNKDYTIIIPTYNNRHKYLNRILDYFSEFDLNVIIVDSSEDKFLDRNDYKVNYIHLPNKNYTLKLHIALEKVNTPYVLLCGDDDFVIPSAIEKCVTFLNQNKSYASVQGNIIAFKNIKRRRISTFPWMMNTYRLDFNQDLAFDRVSQFFNYHIYLHYSLHRKDNLVSSFFLTKDFDDNFAVTTIEYVLDIISIINGKHKVLPIFSYISELAETSARNMTLPISQIKHTTEFKKLTKNLGLYLSQKTKIDDEEAIRFIKNIFKNTWYFKEKSTGYSEGSHPLKKMKLIKKVIDKFTFLNPVKTVYSNFYYYFIKKKREREYKKQIYKTKKLKGYPYYDEKAKNEWLRIKNVIKKHGRINYV